MLKKQWICVMVLCLLFCTAACGEQAAQASNEPGSQYEQAVLTLPGKGTEDDPYLISTKEDLIQLATVVNDQEYYAGNDDVVRAYYRLTADIALNDCPDFSNWDECPPELNWTPIGYDTSFKGHFDGDGHTISGLYIHQAAEQFSSGLISPFGLFGSIDGGEIKNLHMENAYVHPLYVQGIGGMDIAILAGRSDSAITGCTVEGVVICESGSCGGIVGQNDGVVSDCSFSGRMIDRSVYVGDKIGGIAGSGGDIRNCTVDAELSYEASADLSKRPAVWANMGGIVGAIQGDSLIENCTFNGSIRCKEAAGGIVGTAATGIAVTDVQPKTVIRGCVNNGSVLVEAEADAGGIVGNINVFFSDGELRVENCSNFGDVRSLSEDIDANGGIVGEVFTKQTAPVMITGCINEAALSGIQPGGIVGKVMMQNVGNLRIENCTNRGAIRGEGSYSAGILCCIQQLGEPWSIEIDGCINEGDITTDGNAGGIVCFAFATGGSGNSLLITDCVNRGNLRSNGINNYLGGILGVDALSGIPVSITGCKNEGELEFTNPVEIDAETLSGTLITLSRTAGGIVGYVGTAPYITINSGERTVNNINVDDANLNIVNCTSTGRLIHKEARFAEDVYAAMTDEWTDEGTAYVMSFFISVEGGIVGTIVDSEDYSVKITDCTFENAEQEIGDWIPHNR